jgi:thioredoxin 1
MSGDQPLIVSSDAFHAAHRKWRVFCLCAQWCGVCRQYAADFEQLQTKFPEVQFAWVDVESYEDLMGDTDVETFPTLLIGQGDLPVFLGPLLPQIKVLERLLQSLQDEAAVYPVMASETVSLWRRIAAHWH